MYADKVIEAIPTDPALIQRRRAQIAHAALAVFSRKGFHKTRVREIAQEAGVAVGTIYEYVSAKEDILYLACEQGFIEFEQGLNEALSTHSDPSSKLKAAIEVYYHIMDDLNNSILLLYRESQSLDEDGRRMLMRREEDIARIFEGILAEGVEQGIFEVENSKLVSHDIILLAHMWGLKRWTLHSYLDIDQFTRLQTRLILSGILSESPAP